MAEQHRNGGPGLPNAASGTPQSATPTNCASAPYTWPQACAFVACPGRWRGCTSGRDAAPIPAARVTHANRTTPSWTVLDRARAMAGKTSEPLAISALPPRC